MGTPFPSSSSQSVVSINLFITSVYLVHFMSKLIHKSDHLAHRRFNLFWPSPYIIPSAFRTKLQSRHFCQFPLSVAASSCKDQVYNCCDKHRDHWLLVFITPPMKRGARQTGCVKGSTTHLVVFLLCFKQNSMKPPFNMCRLTMSLDIYFKYTI